MIDDWIETTLGAVADICGGGTPSTSEPTYWGGDIVWLTPTEVVKRDGARIGTSERTLTEAGLAHSSAKLLPVNAVLLTSRASVGFVALADRPLATNQGFQSLIAKDGISPEFLMLWIQGNREEFKSRAGGSTFPEISKSNIAGIPISVPPSHVQRRIVDLMAHLDNHLRNLRAEKDAFGVLETSFLDETFEESQETFHLGDIADVFDCEHKTAARASKGEVVYGYSIGTRDIKDGIINIENAKEVTLSTWEQWSRRIEIKVNDILMSREAPVGSVGQVLGEDSLCLGQRTVAIRAHGEFEPSYLAAALRSRRIQSWMVERSSGLTVAHLNVAEIKRMPVPKVLDVERRKMISHLALNFIRSRKLIAQELESLTRYRRSLLSGLLSGEVTVEANYDALLTEVA